MSNLALLATCADVVEWQAGDAQRASLTELAGAAARLAPQGQEHGAITAAEELQGAVEPEVLVLLAMKVGTVGVRDERHGAGMSNHQPYTLGGSNVLRDVPLGGTTERARYIDDFHRSNIR